ncbi:hypothetical protein LGQ03_05915 [Loktanella sp. TSTF-M6]|uniref:Uncharacterized protein n=1 Tax=Loktanella gaetbuli TaxID=2881335 RepID=A0ABS8BSQ7_9RHOB|nr:hypothetical protein [Loktanella gaetbuli]MCB5198770.1 hypothetical protein [Loktanella gaetbuli]
MAISSTITPFRVNKSPTSSFDASALALIAFAQIADLIAAGVAADAEVVQFGDPALAAYADAAADAWAQCQTAVTVFLMRQDVDPILKAAARQVDGLLRDRGDAPEELDLYPLTLRRLAERCLTLRTEWSRQVSAELTHLAALLGALVADAVAEIDLAADDAAFLSIPEA